MSRSHKKIAICGVTNALSDKPSKTLANRKFRRLNTEILKKFLGEKEMKQKYEVSSEWDMEKDGKILYHDKKLLRK